MKTLTKKNKIEEGTFQLEIKEYYYTSDLCLAGILKMSNYPIAEWRNIGEEEGKKKLVFYFKRDDGIDKIVDDYFNLPVEKHPIKKFYMELKEIKNLIYNF